MLKKVLKERTAIIKVALSKKWSTYPVASNLRDSEPD